MQSNYLHLSCSLARRLDVPKRQTRSWAAIIIAMYFFATVHCVMTILFQIRVFTLHGGDPSIVRAYENQNGVFRGFNSSAFVVTVLLADCLFIWRCWLVWERRWLVIVIPVLSAASGTVLSIISIVGQVEVSNKHAPGVVPIHFVKMSSPYFILSLVTSLYSTIFIALRVVLVQRQTNNFTAQAKVQYRPRYSRMIEILVESFALNSINLVAYVIYTFRKDGNLDWPQDIQPQIAGIAPTLVLLRVALGHARPESEWSSPTLRSMIFTSTRVSTADASEISNSETSRSQERHLSLKMKESSDLERITLSTSSTVDGIC
ncbi:hypothetical protein SCHPADRAFT_833072 [Schizopora paradoxa]|uniref:Uncharacterized protein n=1 Tax=Schizopora paradoxa TaxID=27342 RepID=A0A0H2RZ79_9AGAM|nr:hypothetical protein SCHPADRAFT_833072 [Schizopora paradoxa]